MERRGRESGMCCNLIQEEIRNSGVWDVGCVSCVNCVSCASCVVLCELCALLSAVMIPEFGVLFILEKELQNDTIVALG